MRNYYSKTDYLKIKIDNKWFVLDRFRVEYKEVFGKKVVIGNEAFKIGSICIASLDAPCKIVKYNGKYDSFEPFEGSKK